MSEKNEQNFKLIWNTRKELVLAILLFVFAFVIASGSVLSQIKAIKKVNAQLNKTQVELDKFQKKATELEKIAFNAEMQKMGEIEEVLPSHKPLLELLNNLNSVAVETQVIINNFSLSPGEIATDSTKITKSSRQKKYDQLELQFAVSGTLASVQNFMTLIEQVTPISTITSIALNRQINDDSLAETTANLTLKTFYFTQPIVTTITEALPVVSAENSRILDELKKLIPNNLPAQESVIKNDRGNLFGLQNMSVEELEAQLAASQASASAVIWQEYSEDGQIIQPDLQPTQSAPANDL